ncbi:hypothetical protein RIR_jg432.t1 [Rhizophagus irregularis DAOM 181602=DAOM 197198]|uniref:Uncharacterized protein n=1 Tax=Rhizophagus irregularis (strain DAOM 181602 / DAOM 197198 / MUCL 43194) TaxID=747089 RepID=U9TLD0_RHIID|nr:hypothetical protein RIR_jg432.t1 [Rhizophagus irregularis DAOM 181602=DAOM 197198]
MHRILFGRWHRGLAVGLTEVSRRTYNTTVRKLTLNLDAETFQLYAEVEIRDVSQSKRKLQQTVRFSATI